MPWFADHNDANAFIKKTKPPAGTKWVIAEDEGFRDEFSNDYSLRVDGGYWVNAVERWPIEHPALSTPDKWTLESGDPLP